MQDAVQHAGRFDGYVFALFFSLLSTKEKRNKRENKYKSL
jgi:hypothetical protein